MSLIETMGETSRPFHSMWSRSVSSSVLSGSNPTAFDASNPITLFIIQLVIIIASTQGLGWVFKYIKQPKVIAEVIGGIILGPTVFGRIPGFSATVFPKASLPFLNLISTIGLILFLFLVGLEVDVSVIKKNGRNAALISAAGMIIPFALGTAVAVPVYHNFVDGEKTTFGHFLLFVGVAMSITAFPVLCRILVSCKLLDTKVGLIVLAAGVGNDVVGWVLLALTLALVNSGSGVTAVYVLLCAIGWATLLLWPIKKAFIWMARRTGSIDHGPTPGMMVITLVLVFTSAFVTDVIGVHPIFGGFIAGLIIPHEGGFAIALVEKIDDLVSMLFLPIYFVLSGLSTNLGLLNTGKDWGYVILLCTVAWVGKFFGCFGVARLLKYPLREAGAIGMLMSCKGLVELIVLNVGLSAGIIDQRMFSMFVVEAVVLTFMTTPVTLLIYPERVRTRAGVDLERKLTRDNENRGTINMRFGGQGSGGRDVTTKFLVVLQKIEHLASVMLITQMLEPTDVKGISYVASVSDITSKSPSMEGDLNEKSQKAVAIPNLPEGLRSEGQRSGNNVQIDALKLIELTGRTFSVMQSAEKDQLLLTDDALQLYRQFGRLRGLDITPHIEIVDQDSYPAAVADLSADLEAQLVLIPWTIPAFPTSSSVEPSPAVPSEGITPSTSMITRSPFEHIFGTETQSSGSPMYSHYLRRVFSECSADVGLFIDRGFGSSAAFSPGIGQHIFLPFFGGPDDRLALRLVVQLCHRGNVTATIIRFRHNEETDDASTGRSMVGKTEMSESMQAHHHALQTNQLTVGPSSSAFPETVHRIASETADDLAWSYFEAPDSHSGSVQSALSRVNMHTTHAPFILGEAMAACDASMAATAGQLQWRPSLVIIGRGRRGAAEKHDQELTKILAERGQHPSVGAELRKTVGDAATALILGGGASSTASFLVLQAGTK